MIPFNKPYMTGQELGHIKAAHQNGALAGNGAFTKKCENWLESNTETQRVLLTHSCTASLEMCAILLDLAPGDEIIMPSYTFVSTANAFVLRGAIPVFVDIREDTLNLDENLIEEAITDRTKAIIVVHYAGVSCEMDSIIEIGKKHNLAIIEDAAQGMMASYNNKPLGSIGDLATYSFHETKNIISGEGGALLINDDSYIKRAEIIHDKGTDRSQFFRGEVDKYTWQDVGSSYLPGELIAAFLWAQLEEAEQITEERMKIWHYYHSLFEPLEKAGWVRRPTIPANCKHNAHMYYLILNSGLDRNRALKTIQSNGILAIFHYIPLHSSPAGQRFGRTNGELPVTDSHSSQIIRIPLWVGLTRSQQDYIHANFEKAILEQTG